MEEQDKAANKCQSAKCRKVNAVDVVPQGSVGSSNTSWWYKMRSSTTRGSSDELASARRSVGCRFSFSGGIWMSVGAKTVLRLVADILLTALCLRTLRELRAMVISCLKYSNAYFVHSFTGCSHQICLHLLLSIHNLCICMSPYPSTLSFFLLF